MNRVRCGAVKIYEQTYGGLPPLTSLLNNGCSRDSIPACDEIDGPPHTKKDETMLWFLRIERTPHAIHTIHRHPPPLASYHPSAYGGGIVTIVLLAWLACIFVFSRWWHLNSPSGDFAIERQKE